MVTVGEAGNGVGGQGACSGTGHAQAHKLDPNGMGIHLITDLKNHKHTCACNFPCIEYYIIKTEKIY